MHAFSEFADILDYPAGNIPHRLDKLVKVSCAEDERVCGLLRKFKTECERLGIGLLEEIYTGAFDLDAKSSLHAGYQLFGDSWRRSEFLSRLQLLYRERGFSAGIELPDHICAILRFISGQAESPESQDLIDCFLAPALTKILSRVDRAANPYSAALEALLLWIRPNTGEAKAE